MGPLESGEKWKMRIMKTFNRLLVFGLGIFLATNLLHAQQADFASIHVSLESPTEVKTMLEALTLVEPVPFDTLPRNKRNQVISSGFWSMQNPSWPPLPSNFYTLSVWPLGDGTFVLDDRQVDYAAIQAEAKLEAAAALNSGGSQMRMMMSSLSSYAYGNPVCLTNLVVTTAPMTASFDIVGGTNNVPYDILMATNLLTPTGAWNWLGIGYTSNRYSFTSQPADRAFYRLAKPVRTMIVGWGEDAHYQTEIPVGITNAVMVAGGYFQGLALLSDGTLRSWGDNFYTSSPTNITGVAMIAGGWNHNLALQTNGVVTVWGYNFYGELNMPFPITNGVVISGQAYNSLVLLSNGTLVAWGDNSSGQASVPANLTNVIAIACGGEHNLAVRADGTVAAWGNNGHGQTIVPAGLSNVWDVAAGWAHSVALKKDGTVVCWGDNSYGESFVPAGLSNVVMIAAGGVPLSGYTLAIKKDGSVAVWGKNKVNTSFGGLNQVIAVGGGYDYAFAIRTGPPTPVVILEPVDQYKVAGDSVSFTATGQGLYGVTYQWQTNGVNLTGATNTTLTLTNVQAAQRGSYRVMVNDNAGYGSFASSNAVFTLVTAPAIASQSPMPTNYVAVYQTNLTLSVTAAAPGETNGFPLQYQWRFNGTNLFGETTSSHTFVIDSPLLGAYSVTVRNAAGSITSLVWQVTMTYVGSYIDVGTLAYHLSTNAVGHTNGFTGSTNDMEEYTMPPSVNLNRITNAVWSTNFWLKGMHGLSATTIGYSNQLSRAGLITMVSPRHYLFAGHVKPDGHTIAFLDTNNVLYWRKTLQRADIGTNLIDIQYKDTSVGILDADLPSSVGYLPVLPTTYTNYIPLTGGRVQGIGMNQDVLVFGQPMSFRNSDISWDTNNTGFLDVCSGS